MWKQLQESVKFTFTVDATWMLCFVDDMILMVLGIGLGWCKLFEFVLVVELIIGMGLGPTKNFVLATCKLHVHVTTAIPKNQRANEDVVGRMCPGNLLYPAGSFDGDGTQFSW